MMRPLPSPIVLLLLVACGGDAAKDGDTALPTDGATPTGPTAAQTDLYINEVVTSNASGLQDDGGAYPDWIEIYNAGAEAVSLEGYALSEEEGWKDQWTFGEGVTIEPGGRLVVFADEDTDEGALHASFKLSADGEELVLYGPADEGSPWLDEVDIPALTPDTSYARETDGASTWIVDETPTPGAENG